MVWLIAGKKKNPAGFSSCSTAEEVSGGIDGHGLVAIVTGASGGLGTETTRVLALRGVHVYMAVRNVENGASVKQEILKDNPTAEIDIMQLDLASLESVKQFASEFTSLNQALHILINNAGVMACPYLLSKDGIEMQFATNHIGHFLLTYLLLEKMKITARDSKVEGKIVNVSGELHRATYQGGIRFDKINEKSGYDSWKAYGQSKLANILHANELSRRFKEEGVQITANSLHPGVIGTDLSRHLGFSKVLLRTVGKIFLKDVPQGAATTCFIALHLA